MTERNNYPVHRTKRAHGIRKQDAAAMAQFEYEKKQRPAESVARPIEIKPACRCGKYPFAHIHG